MEGSWSRTVRTESGIARKQPPNVLPVRCGPWIDRPDTCVSELPFVSGDDDKPATGGRSREHGVREMAVERFTPPAFFFQDACTFLRVGCCPVEPPVFEEVIQKVLDLPGKIRPARSGIEPADSVEHLPEG